MPDEVFLTAVKGLKFVSINSSLTTGTHSTGRTGANYLPDCVLSWDAVISIHPSITKHLLISSVVTIGVLKTTTLILCLQSGLELVLVVLQCLGSAKKNLV